MYILSFETSCDDTSVALFEYDKLLSMDTASQIKIHEETGGVVPEVAAREHANNIFKVLEKVLILSWIKLNQINYLAVTVTPWLIPSLLTWITVAKTISKTLNIPLIEINHIEAHIFSNYLERSELDIHYPLVCLTVSWWHNEIYFMKDMFDFKKVWWTQDDSAWEAFDKVAKMMWLCYPGWPIISKLAEEYRIKNNWKSKKLFPRSWLIKDELNFSFSWLKSSVKREIDKRIELNWKLSEQDKQELAFEFQEAVTEVLATKLVNSSEKFWVKTVMLSGWVSANDRLKEYITELIKWKDIKFIYPIKKVYSMDNAAMVGINAYYKIKSNKF